MEENNMKRNIENEITEKKVTEKEAAEKERTENNTTISRKKWLRIRALWSVLGILVCLYLTYYWVIGGSDTGRIVFKLYMDFFTPLFLLYVVILVLYIAKMEKDFFRGFYLAFARKGKGVSRMELQRAVRAFECAEKTAVTAGFITFMFGFLGIISSPNLNTYEADVQIRALTPMIGLAGCYAIYPAVFVLILAPVKLRLEQKLISYMEEPEDEEVEQTEADEQRLYFGLRAMGLTDREAEVARLAGSGISNKEISQQLYISEGTVKKHMTHILEKSGCTDREALAKKLKNL